MRLATDETDRYDVVAELNNFPKSGYFAESVSGDWVSWWCRLWVVHGRFREECSRVRRVAVAWGATRRRRT